MQGEVMISLMQEAKEERQQFQREFISIFRQVLRTAV
jgi:uncharacterized protein YnzC (UPF0291/DUF896 family)